MKKSSLITIALVIALSAPAGAWVEDRQYNPFAVYDNSLAYTNIYRDQSYQNIDMVVAGGSGTVRQISTEAAWWGGSAGGVEQTFGVYTFDAIDAAVTLADARGVNVFLMIKTAGGAMVPSDWVDMETPCDACEGVAPGTNASYPPLDLTDPPMNGYQHFYDFAYAVVEHYDGSHGVPEVRYYEFQSEPDSPSYWYGSPEQYWGGSETVVIERAGSLPPVELPEGMMPVFAQAVRDANPRALIVGGSYTDGPMLAYQQGTARPRMVEFGDALFDHHEYWDILGVHNYAGYKNLLMGYHFWDFTQWFFDELTAHGLDREVWFTELGIWFPGTETQHAMTMLKSMTTALHLGTDRFCYFPNRGPELFYAPPIFLFTLPNYHSDIEFTGTWRFLARALEDRSVYTPLPRIDEGSARLLPFDIDGTMLVAAWCEEECPEGAIVNLTLLFGLGGGDYTVFDYKGTDPFHPCTPVVMITEDPVLLAWGTDSDGDRIPDAVDDCPDEPDPDQIDTDGDGIGDVCDNCPDMVNTWQEDQDDDGYGDRCDCAGFEDHPGIYPGSDFDGDGHLACDDDCDDTAPEVFPGHAEILGNGIDDDCDGAIDEPCFVGLVF